MSRSRRARSTRPGRRLAAVARYFQIGALARKATIRMMRADIDAVEIGAGLAELPFQAAMHRGNVAFARLPARNDGLVGQDDEAKSRVPQRDKRFRDAWDEFQFRRPAHAAFLDIERAVAVEKYRRPPAV